MGVGGAAVLGRLLGGSVGAYPRGAARRQRAGALAGGGGYAINLGADATTLKTEGEAHIRVYETNPGSSTKEAKCGRRFCGACGTALWHYDPTWPDLVHPFASAIDTDLPEAPSHTHIMLGSKANWVLVEAGEGDEVFDGYPELSLAEWHRRYI